jgi:hypothetical protein
VVYLHAFARSVVEDADVGLSWRPSEGRDDDLGCLDHRSLNFNAVK